MSALEGFCVCNRRYKLAIVNVVATANLRQEVDLDAVSKLPNVLYDFDIYPCAYFKDETMKGKVSIFGSGKMISIGTMSESDAFADLNHVAQTLWEAEIIKPTSLDLKIRNIVATLDLGRPIDLERLTHQLKGIVYEPEQFPGAIYRPSSGKDVSALIFASGKIVLAGIRSGKLVPILAKQITKEIDLVS